MRTHLFAAIGLTIGAALLSPVGCASDAGSQGPAEDAATQDEASNRALAPHYYTATQDGRWCQTAPCRGWVVQEVNSTEPAQLVGSLSFAGAGLDDGATGAVLEAPRGDLVLWGSPSLDANGAPAFNVRGAYRGLPGVDAAKDEAYFVVRPRDPRIECLVAPCNNLIAQRLETDEEVDFTSLALDRPERLRVDTTWLEDRILHHGAVVAGHFRDGQVFPGGPERVLDVGQAFVRLPDRGGPCFLLRHVCREGYRAEYVRSADRCLMFQGCVQTRACIPALPAPCADGYTMVRWASAAPACYSTVCDPAFLAE